MRTNIFYLVTDYKTRKLRRFDVRLEQTPTVVYLPSTGIHNDGQLRKFKHTIIVHNEIKSLIVLCLQLVMMLKYKMQLSS